MYRLLPFLFLLAIIPDSEKKMETLNSFVMSTKDSVASIRNGMETFQATMMPFMMSQAGDKAGRAPSAGGREGENQG